MNLIVYEALGFLKRFVSQQHGCRNLMLKFGSENPELAFFDYFNRFPSFTEMIPTIKGLTLQIKGLGSQLNLPHDTSGYLKPVKMIVITFCVFGAPLTIQTLRDIKEIVGFKEHRDPLFADYELKENSSDSLLAKLMHNRASPRKEFTDFFINEESVNPFKNINILDQALGLSQALQNRYVAIDPIDCQEQEIRSQIEQIQEEAKKSYIKKKRQNEEHKTLNISDKRHDNRIKENKKKAKGNKKKTNKKQKQKQQKKIKQDDNKDSESEEESSRSESS